MLSHIIYHCGGNTAAAESFPTQAKHCEIVIDSNITNIVQKKKAD